MKKRWWIIGSITAVLVIGAVGVKLMGSEQAIGMQVQVGSVMTSTLESRILTSGSVVAEEKHKLYANVNGTLREFTLKEGDVVKKGQVIGKIDTSDVESRLLELDAQIELARANLSKAQAGSEPEELAQERERVAQAEREYEAAKKEYERLHQLFTSGATTQQEVDRAKGQLDSHLSSLNVAKQQLTLKQKGPRKEEVASLQAQINKYQVDKTGLEKERTQSVLIAPEDGTVISLATDNGQYVNKGTEILTLANLNNLLVQADINESDISKIKLGQTATIEGSSLGKQKLNAKVIRIAPVAVTTQSSSGTSEKTRVKVTMQPEGDVSAMKPGFHVDIDILTEKTENALQVPIEAVQQEQDGSTYVWIADGGLAKKAKVTVGMENELSSEIKSGLTGDEQIILNPSEGLQEDTPVTPSTMPGIAGM
ncbi:efflux RND transporter periplasmic adaptor subunit [Brevibacillus ruminantium]|uniref:Efflux RND transporter periplasmic adaptor subunit n=1 Tax=Brevibacillus ruminantium TaxID=2950604 RepID=A0ABY4WCG6_9BACL|nr:efflux RND transporter periplasmic adaptor subunit [Brevibacillus ruminantium]USG64872.1 efflux RND transporter periplasmic adaptor subunit [Brevibacillus ruminantium]